MFKRINLFAVIMIAVLCTLSCITTPVTVTSSNTPLQNRVITENLGKTEGSHSAYSVLSLWMIGKPDIEIAIEEALKKKNADALINIRCYRTTHFFLFVSVSKVTVEGDAVKLSGANDDKKGDKKQKQR
jgi:hypothetical protein